MALRPWLLTRPGHVHHAPPQVGRDTDAFKIAKVANYLELRDLLPQELKQRLIPVAQGWLLSHYLEILRMYADAGVDLRTLPLVGLGSVCRRQHTGEIAEIVGALADRGLRNTHGFGVKADGLDAPGRPGRLRRRSRPDPRHHQLPSTTHHP